MYTEIPVHRSWFKWRSVQNVMNKKERVHKGGNKLR